MPFKKFDCIMPYFVPISFSYVAIESGFATASMVALVASYLLVKKVCNHSYPS